MKKVPKLPAGRITGRSESIRDRGILGFLRLRLRSTSVDDTNTSFIWPGLSRDWTQRIVIYGAVWPDPRRLRRSDTRKASPETGLNTISMNSHGLKTVQLGDKRRL